MPIKEKIEKPHGVPEANARSAEFVSSKFVVGAELKRVGNIIPMKTKSDRARAGEKPETMRIVESGTTRASQTAITDQIGRQLRGMYDGLLNQPVPDRFLDLVRQLETASEPAEEQEL